MYISGGYVCAVLWAENVIGSMLAQMNTKKSIRATTDYTACTFATVLSRTSQCNKLMESKHVFQHFYF